jgi:hypothetical protein
MAIFAETVVAYSADTDKAQCKKPKFRKFKPPHKSEVAPGTEISFHVTHVVEPESIKVTAKKIPVDIAVEDKNAFYSVKGKLPESLQGTYARISIKAGTETGCKEQGGWLLKITEAAEADEKPAAENESVNATEKPAIEPVNEQ